MGDHAPVAKGVFAVNGPVIICGSHTWPGTTHDKKIAIDGAGDHRWNDNLHTHQISSTSGEIPANRTQGDS